MSTLGGNNNTFLHSFNSRGPGRGRSFTAIFSLGHNHVENLTPDLSGFRASACSQDCSGIPPSPEYRCLVLGLSGCRGRFLSAREGNPYLCIQKLNEVTKIGVMSIYSRMYSIYIYIYIYSGTSNSNPSEEWVHPKLPSINPNCGPTSRPTGGCVDASFTSPVLRQASIRGLPLQAIRALYIPYQALVG